MKGRHDAKFNDDEAYVPLSAFQKLGRQVVAHGGRKLTFRGAPLETAEVAVLLLHGRGDSAQGILGLADMLKTEGVAYAAPEAEGNAWYPQSFLQPLEQNEPQLSKALQTVEDALAELSDAGFARENVVLMGFSQGACLALEFAARNATRYGGVVALSGGLIGPDSRFDTEAGSVPHGYSGSLGGTPVFLGCGAADTHIPEGRVMISAGVMKGLGGDAHARIYPGMGHTVVQEELDAADVIVAGAKRG